MLWATLAISALALANTARLAYNKIRYGRFFRR